MFVFARTLECGEPLQSIVPEPAGIDMEVLCCPLVEAFSGKVIRTIAYAGEMAASHDCDLIMCDRFRTPLWCSKV